MKRVLSFLCVALFLVACSDRAYAPVVPEAAAIQKKHTLLVATNRTLSNQGFFDSGRGSQVQFRKTSVSVPLKHQPGKFSVSYRDPNPEKHFAIAAQTTLESQEAFLREVNRELAQRPPADQDVLVFVHGYFNSYANAVYRSAQVVEDLKVRGVVVPFSWPSAGKAFGYTYDRESVLYSRNDFETLLRLLSRSNARRVIVVAHSMGSALLMETMRQIELQEPGWSHRNISAVALISPDVPIDLFRQQAHQIQPLPDPFVIAVSQKDRVLQLSQQLNNNTVRLGRAKDIDQLADLDVIIIDLTNVADGKGDGHFAVAESQGVIELFDKVGDLERILGLQTDNPLDQLTSTVVRSQRATEYVLSPSGTGTP
ncbi:alpha/beta hydrolase [Shimia biformata]|uniref:alpha/beta hydrolase n=1 Tax=Shimia biformata TaxID=1294299 RepID=UPI00194E75E9|nr:alpha/beta fold hydrolase [Shimia biformata]